ncbi:MAG: outer membrane lipoprotein carrier protein LolA [Acidobacteria bacterium]|nr:outer membrane lipoprotein carrier protein LolA [Acidobacteriota bacterium]MBI3662091.1 outer membrane lipoprotein carrier protein LolA [Acidobacteriota bacterium]
MSAAWTAALAVAAQGKTTWTLEDLLKQLDSEAKSFRALSANVERTKVTVVVNDRSTETGQILVRGDDKMLLELNAPDGRIILRDGGKLFVYNPKAKRVDEYDLGKHRALVDQFLLLGFGSSGSDLKKGYLVTLQGEQVLDKKKVFLLDLTPKSDKVREQFSKIQLWIDEATWLPVRQKFLETGSGDYLEIHYTNIMRNPKIPDSRFKKLWPKGVTKVKPQG